MPKLLPSSAAHPDANGRVCPARTLARAARRILLCLTIVALSLWGGQAESATAMSVGIWQQLSTDTPPPARSQYGMAVDNSGNVYIYGGRGADGAALGDFWVLRPADGTWRQLPNGGIPPLIEPHLASDAAGRVFEFGGIANPPADHLSFDGHSYGLYEYDPGQETWTDLTRVEAQLGTDWPPGREDHGFAFDPDSGKFLAFAGEGNDDHSLNDLWSYDEASNTWTPRQQSYNAPGGAEIAPREIYNISYDYHGGFYLFGGAYLSDAANQPISPTYANDLWHLDVASGTWTLLAGTANAYDPSMPLPRHYYGQLCDNQGNFYMLGGYLSDSARPPFFSNDQFSSYAQDLPFGGGNPTGIQTYALADFWQFSAGSRQWVDMSNELGGVQGSIPYNMVLDRADGLFVTFGGFHAAVGVLVPSSGTWTYSPEPGSLDPQPATATATPTATMVPPATPAPSTVMAISSPVDTATPDRPAPAVTVVTAATEPAIALPQQPIATATQAIRIAQALPLPTAVSPGLGRMSAPEDPQTPGSYQDPLRDLDGIVPIPGFDTNPPLP